MSVNLKKPSVFVALLLGNERQNWPSPTLMDFTCQLVGLQERGLRKINITKIWGRVPHDSARNYAADEFLKSGCEWMLQIDNDMTVHHSILEMLDTAPKDADIVVPRYFALCNGGTEANPSMTLSLCWLLKPGRPVGIEEFTPIDGSGAGVLDRQRERRDS